MQRRAFETRMGPKALTANTLSKAPLVEPGQRRLCRARHLMDAYGQFARTTPNHSRLWTNDHEAQSRLRQLRGHDDG